MSIQNIPVNGTTFLAEGSTAAVNSAAATSVTIVGNVITVNLTTHGLVVGDLFTLSGVTGATGLNDQTWQVATVVNANSFTANIAAGSSVAGTPAGTILVQRVFQPGPGMAFVSTGANCIVEYSPTNAIPGVPGQTWRTLIAASSQGLAFFDAVGAVRVRVSTGTAGTTRWSLVA